MSTPTVSVRERIAALNAESKPADPVAKVTNKVPAAVKPTTVVTTTLVTAALPASNTAASKLESRAVTVLVPPARGAALLNKAEVPSAFQTAAAGAASSVLAVAKKVEVLATPAQEIVETLPFSSFAARRALVAAVMPAAGKVPGVVVNSKTPAKKWAPVNTKPQMDPTGASLVTAHTPVAQEKMPSFAERRALAANLLGAGSSLNKEKEGVREEAKIQQTGAEVDESWVVVPRLPSLASNRPKKLTTSLNSNTSVSASGVQTPPSGMGGLLAQIQARRKD